MDEHCVPLLVFVQTEIPQPVDLVLSELSNNFNLIKIHKVDSLENYVNVHSQADTLVGGGFMTQHNYTYNAPLFFFVCDKETLVDNSLLYVVGYHPEWSERCPLDFIGYVCAMVASDSMVSMDALDEIRRENEKRQNLL